MLGQSVPAYKLAVFVIAALYAGLAGGLLGVFQSYMPPDAFSLDTSGDLVVQTIIGGVGTLIGPLVGATVWLYLRDNLQLIPGVGPLWKLILGVVFVVLVAALKRGIVGEIRHLFVRRRLRARAAEVPEEGGAAGEPPPPALSLPMAAPVRAAEGEAPAMRAAGLSKQYGGLRAVDGVSFAVRAGSIHAVIGPNGAGKSTLFKMLLDEVSPTAGEVRLFGRRVTGLGATRAAQLGIGKSNQLNQLFLEMTVADNLRVAALARGRGPFRADVLRAADGLPAVERQVAAAMETVGLAHRADVPVHVLPYGEKRRLEIGLALATGPSVLLLDEPLAGMSPAERAATRVLIREIGKGRTLLIVEHDMDAVCELAERITVLQEGRLLAEGTARLKDPKTLYAGLMLFQGVTKRWPDLEVARSARRTLLEYEEKPEKPWQADDLAEHANVATDDRLHRVVLGLEPNMVPLAEEPLHGCLLAHERDHDLAVLRDVLRSNHDKVSVEDADVLHRLPLDSEQVFAVVAPGVRRRLDVFLNVLLG